eukprot:5675-Heterococcus_DN1.PRE.1
MTWAMVHPYCQVAKLIDGMVHCSVLAWPCALLLASSRVPACTANAKRVLLDNVGAHPCVCCHHVAIQTQAHSLIGAPTLFELEFHVNKQSVQPMHAPYALQSHGFRS